MVSCVLRWRQTVSLIVKRSLHASCTTRLGSEHVVAIAPLTKIRNHVSFCRNAASRHFATCALIATRVANLAFEAVRPCGGAWKRLGNDSPGNKSHVPSHLALKAKRNSRLPVYRYASKRSAGDELLTLDKDSSLSSMQDVHMCSW